MQSSNNGTSFFTSFLKNKFIFSVIASVIVITIGFFKAIKSSPPSPPPSQPDKNKDDKELKTSSKQDQDNFLKDLQKEIDRIKPSTTNIESQTIDIQNITNKKVNGDFILLPHQILYQLFELISPKDFINCSMINKKWNSVICKLDKCWIQYSIDRWNLQNSYPFDETKNKNKEFFKKKYIEDFKRLGFKPESYIITIMSECSEFTESGRWKSEKIINPNGSWWKKRFLEEMNKCLTMTTFNINNSSNNSGSFGNRKIKNSINNNNNNNDDDSEESEEEEEEEEEGIEGRSTTGNIVLNGKVNTPIGSFRFIDKEDALLKFKGETWLDKHYTSEDSPYTGDVVGYFNFSLFPLDCDEELFLPYKSQIVEFLRILTFGTRGTVTRLKLNYSIHSIVYEQCSLSSIFGKYGFNDGDALLDTDQTSSYIVQLIEEIQNFLDKQNVGINSIEGGARVVYTDKTSHNPIRYSGYLSKDSLQLELGLWIYNSVILQSRRLWNRKLED